MADYRAIARQAAQRHGLDPGVFLRQIQQESGFNPTARSGAGAIGIAQIMPATARGWGVDPTDPAAALNAAAKHMAGYVKQFGSYRNALIAYNAGPGAVGRALPAETSNYISVILGGRTPSTRSVRSGGGTPASGTTTTDVASDPHLAYSPGSIAASLGLLTGAVKQKPQSTAPTAPVFSAKAPLPTAYATPQTTGAPKARFDQGAAAEALRTLSASQGTPSSSSTFTTTPRSSASSGDTGGADGTVQQLVSRANAINAKHLPYLWGGGHGGKVNAYKAAPLDCSGAVSAVLGINPRVSGQFAQWGKAGDGGKSGVTVYANDHHVLMKINGHFFGTSSTNPGGGAGWIPQKAISSGYLKGFTARHE